MLRPGTTTRALALAGLAALLGGCAAGQYTDAAEALLTRNPHAALEYAGLALAADKDHEPAISLVRVKLLKSIAMEHEAKVAAMVAAGNYELAVADCDRVVASAALAATFPGGQMQIYHEDHRAELAGKAAEKFYQEGVRHQEAGDARSAVQAYCRALGFRPGYKDTRARYQACLDAAKVRLCIRVEGGQDAQAVRTVAEGIPRAARGRGLQFLEFVSEPSQAAATCVVRAESAVFNDTDWQGQDGYNEVWVAKRDPNTGRTLTDSTGQAIQEKKTGSWTTFSRQVSYEVRFAFQVEGKDGTPGPSGAAAHSAGDRGVYARWQGAVEAVPADVRGLPSTPGQLKRRDVLAQECAARAIDELAHQLFLAYEK